MIRNYIQLEETDLKQFFSWVGKVLSENVRYLGYSADAAAAAAEAVAAAVIAVVAAVADVPVGAVDVAVEVVEEAVAVFLAVIAAAADVVLMVAVAVAWPWGMMAFQPQRHPPAWAAAGAANIPVATAAKSEDGAAVATEAVVASGAVVTAALAAAGQHVSYFFEVETSLWAPPSAHPAEK